MKKTLFLMFVVGFFASASAADCEELRFRQPQTDYQVQSVRPSQTELNSDSPPPPSEMYDELTVTSLDTAASYGTQKELLVISNQKAYRKGGSFLLYKNKGTATYFLRGTLHKEVELKLAEKKLGYVYYKETKSSTRWVFRKTPFGVKIWVSRTIQDPLDSGYDVFDEHADYYRE